MINSNPVRSIAYTLCSDALIDVIADFHDCVDGYDDEEYEFIMDNRNEICATIQLLAARMEQVSTNIKNGDIDGME